MRRLIANEDFRTGKESRVVANEFIKELNLGRVVPLEALRTVVEEAMQRYPRERSDPWLSPRVHATLRLTRREAADKRIWNYLTIVEFPDYVRWRFEDEEEADKPVPVDRFMGEDSKNALARLWWTAELIRNGKDYSPTTEVSSRFFVSWQHLDLLHHRPAALAIVRFLKRFNDGKGATDQQSQVFAKAVNLVLTTQSLDALCDNPPVDVEATREWCAEPIDETKMMDALPVGPDEEPVPEESIARVESVLMRLAEEINLASVKRARRLPRRVIDPDGQDLESVEDSSSVPSEEHGQNE
ncbi:MAG: hypothetical protein HYZ89_02885 [Candidatus Omnitrophica bacterium]|nr:hypothetical protein [Candidatus Omnitrophota bacterium]